ncbi:MAG: glycosyltransferase family 4 protein [Campylobacterales bacterium]|nr:glycosyltransferase family 4 protein [Campylobacterales bacterium]
MKKILKTQIIKLRNKILQSPSLRNKITSALNHYPNLKIRLKGLTSQNIHYEHWLPSREKNELLVDVSHIYKEDLRTGIQRVVRAVLHYLENTSLELDLQPIYLTDEDGYWCYKYVKSPKTIVVPKQGDIFLGLDLNKMIYAPNQSGLLKDWETRGIAINFLVYDILPIQFPQFYTQDVSIFYRLWLNTVIRYSSKLICISQTVCNDVKKYINENKEQFLTIPKVNWFHLGADIKNTQQTNGIPSNADKIISNLQIIPSFLIVSTIEPRKAHKQTLEAFERLWAKEIDVSLVIVGKLGWMMDEFKTRIQTHPELNKRLYWLKDISDAYLEKIYSASTCLIAPSIAEGFGLPLIEAAQYKKPIIARDIPIFREVAGEYAYYFKDSNDPKTIVASIENWLELYKKDLQPKSDTMQWLTWKESTRQLIKCMMDN